MNIVVIVKSEINIVWNFCFGIIILFFVKNWENVFVLWIIIICVKFWKICVF